MFLARKLQNKQFIWKNKERLQEKTKHRMKNKKIKGLKRERLPVRNF